MRRVEWVARGAGSMYTPGFYMMRRATVMRRDFLSEACI